MIDAMCLLSGCAKHCSLCYNETECYECTQGYYMTEIAECQRKFIYKFQRLKLLIEPLGSVGRQVPKLYMSPS